MTKHITWVILGATSIIAKEFGHLAAQAGHSVLLSGRDRPELEIIASDLRLRYHINCDILYCDFANNVMEFVTILQNMPQELGLFIATSCILTNSQLTPNHIETLINVNIVSLIQLIHAYLYKPQTQHRLIFLSSVAACGGRAKNSLYGASKRAVEIYLQGLQQSATKSQHITVIRLGFIDTIQTFGQPGIFYAASPQACAKACWKASYSNKRFIYYPWFWRYIMAIIHFALKFLPGILKI